MLTGLLGDFRFGLRMLARHRTPTLVIITTLALAVGANTALFSIVHQVLLAPLPFQDEEQLYFLWQGPGSGSVSPRNYQDWKENSRLFEMAAFDSFEITLTGPSDPQRLNALRTSHDFLEVLGGGLLRGRFFSEEEDVPGGPQVAVISSRLWQEAYGADEQILNRQIVVDGIAHDVIGVLPESFEFLGETRGNRYELILPISFTERQLDQSQRGAQWIGIVGRLAKDRTVEQAHQEFSTIIDQLQSRSRGIPEDSEVTMVPVRHEIVGDVEIVLWALLGAVGVVLLVALLNVTGLLLARASARRGEFALRSALGATAGHLARQSLIESVILALLSGGLGLLLALLSRDLLVALAPAGIPRLEQAGLNMSVLLFGFVATAGTGLVLGLTPVSAAWSLRLSDTLADLQRSTRGSTLSKRFAAFLVMAEIALAVVVLSTAGLLARSLLNLENVEPGFDSENVFRFRLSLPDSQYATPQRVDQFYRELCERLEQLPATIQCGAIMHLPLGQDGNVFSSFNVENHTGEDEFVANLRPVTPGYFESMGIPILSGRDFRAADDLRAAGVMIVNQSFVDRFLPGEQVLGQRVRPHVGLAERGRWASIIGVVGDVHHQSLAEAPRPEMYIPHSQSPVSNMSVVLRTRAGAEDVISEVRSIVRNLDPELPVYDLNTLGEIRARSLGSARFQALLFGSFAGIALFLACVGVFGLVSYRIASQTSEIGVRRALGAQNHQIVHLVLRQGLVLTGAGLLAGLAGALLTGRLVESLLFQVKPVDPISLLILSGVLALAAFLATLQPAFKALRIPPLIALRGESGPARG